ncbi:hypothetical protein CI109_103039 [Kwoniella shandongensis]|uniref:Uncharacterized protein n=1 Tax=Kwoniella shandongensis TaxID=1734106 RepID=A0A5M6CE32_9TREE|nr:uncharacterized protein CI109_000230 [Kwoniella shandongensis]KAA5531389.1 hypothetical protein CI109_000230 [Kwoniella shandongensis]
MTPSHSFAFSTVLALLSAPLFASAACTPNTSDTSALQSLIQQGGAGYTLQLCAGQTYNLTDTLNYTAANQEISTEGYPQDDTRATLIITGFNKTSAVQAQSDGLSGAKLRNVQINGNRLPTEAIYTAPNANIEFGGSNQNQLIEYVRSYDPRGWSCMHIAEGPFKCANVTVQNNDIGPCGTDAFQNWADGVSLSCSDSLVQNNVITDATDGGIVIFGAPFSTIRNNTIKAKTRTMLGGINLVDVLPWLPEGNFSHVLVEDNKIHGGFATDLGNATAGVNNASAIIKIGIAIGPDVWFSDGRYGTNQSTGGTVQGNSFSGAFAFAIGVSSAKNFVIQNNSFTGNTSFIGTYGPNCTSSTQTPHEPVALLLEPSSVSNITITTPPDSPFTFTNGTALGLTCFVPPKGENAWPYGDGGVNSLTASSTSGNETTGNDGSSTGSGAGSATSSAAASATGQQSAGVRGVDIASMGSMVVLGLGMIGGAIAVVL